MSKDVNFLIYCLEQYKNAKSLTGRQVMALFRRHEVVEYITACYEALHTTGDNYIINDIDQYISARQTAN